MQVYFYNSKQILFYLARGDKETDPNNDLFFQAKALDENNSYPMLKELKENFHKIYPVIYGALLAITDAWLSEEFPLHMNVSFFSGNCTQLYWYLHRQRRFPLRPNGVNA
ncbi:hypothetical protein SAMN05444682_104285 [Parapedobacter indicus]|uniref:Uncharacterized protein n=1 Tax=Parapedobacter indicus TaxID=1477437 RepID=A0A1I3J130_9SPHI|nr:hypothetical protein CLV26_104286 [Parapedobacter indicus]SFI53972.1 hypothetical protein SAMN05444682_104285 [Parapedobacter indicus]